jgi:hypothetical protein
VCSDRDFQIDEAAHCINPVRKAVKRARVQSQAAGQLQQPLNTRPLINQADNSKRSTPAANLPTLLKYIGASCIIMAGLQTPSITPGLLGLK